MYPKTGIGALTKSADSVILYIGGLRKVHEGRSPPIAGASSQSRRVVGRSPREGGQRDVVPPFLDPFCLDQAQADSRGVEFALWVVLGPNEGATGHLQRPVFRGLNGGVPAPFPNRPNAVLRLASCDRAPLKPFHFVPKSAISTSTHEKNSSAAGVRYGCYDRDRVRP